MRDLKENEREKGKILRTNELESSGEEVFIFYVGGKSRGEVASRMRVEEKSRDVGREGVV